MNQEPSPLLVKLQAQIDEDKDFAFAVRNVGGETPAEFRAICRQIFADLFDTAEAHWFDLMDKMKAWHPKLSETALVEHYDALQSCWVGDFSRAIMNVADNPETDRGDRDFLYFMLGILRCGWHEYIRRLHAGRIIEMNSSLVVP
jgi:hypothetical protein